MSDLFGLTDTQMARLEPFFPKSHGKLRVDDRRVLSGIVFINHNGLRWRDAPKEYGPHKTLYKVPLQSLPLSGNPPLCRWVRPPTQQIV